MGEDLGQMVMVVRQTKSMVVMLLGEPSTKKLKRPESLIQLEDVLVLEHDSRGMLWIQQEREG